ncbi:unnamed protein product (macronuclear) [Paramecium tetraurelia]|uniref:Uncharacterized protein n=1 Tax=Paramecium tetraurelia TaxID=5888 RepID=A0C108_PARTE|nr:uncharacterized protein GSPATT00033951001 [Paramecium tetraurelia]CAK64475.1 unnamed protein product [Paramecium tetraurelia]|eukprot:XP_001431873.1 hypothetical protein (macronuclear) [Paramecium tetraurelia strain d4-2]
MKTKPKMNQSTSAKKLNTQLPSDSLRSSQIKEEIRDDLTSWDSRFESTAIDYPFSKYMNPNKLTKKKGIPDTSREQSARLKKSNTNSTLISSPRLMSPKEQVEVIHYLELKNKTLLEENKRKEHLIAKLLKNKSPPKENIKIALQYPPKSAELCSPATRFPQLATPQPNEFQVPMFQKNPQVKVIQNDQNYSFGKLQDEERDNKTKSQFAKLVNGGGNQKSIIKTNFSKPLLKLPKEFHLQSWNSIKK